MNKVQDIAVPQSAMGAMDLLAPPPPDGVNGDMRKKSVVSTGPMGECESCLQFCKNHLAWSDNLIFSRRRIVSEAVQKRHSGGQCVIQRGCKKSHLRDPSSTLYVHSLPAISQEDTDTILARNIKSSRKYLHFDRFIRALRWIRERTKRAFFSVETVFLSRLIKGFLAKCPFTRTHPLLTWVTERSPLFSPADPLFLSTAFVIWVAVPNITNNPSSQCMCHSSQLLDFTAGCICLLLTVVQHSHHIYLRSTQSERDSFHFWTMDLLIASVIESVAAQPSLQCEWTPTKSRKGGWCVLCTAL